MTVLVLVFAPYKTGTMSVYNAIKATGLDCHRLHGYDYDDQLECPPETVTHIITIDRSNKLEWWLSAFFQDITEPEYPYYYSESETDILNTSPQELLDHFLKWPWAEYRWTNWEYYQNTIYQVFGIELIQGQYGVFNSQKLDIERVAHPKVFYINLESLNDCEEDLEKFLGVEFLTIPKTNTGSTKWYAKKYKEVKKLIRLSP